MKTLSWFSLSMVFGILIGCNACASTKVDKDDIWKVTIKESLSRNVVIKSGLMGTCSGVIVSTNRILTVAHCKDQVLRVNDNSATVLAEDTTSDLMLLQVPTASHEPVVLGCVPEVTDRVFTIGNPANFHFVVSLGRVVKLEPNIIYVDTLVAPGISGGGLYNNQGSLIGIMNMIYGGKLNNGANYVLFGSAIHTQAVRKFLEGRL